MSGSVQGRWGLIADVHANRPALDAVLIALEDERVEGVVVAGDLVGYGPYPNECLTRLAEIGAVCVLGNHDLLALNRLDGLDLRRFPAYARVSAEHTRKTLGRPEREFLETLPLVRSVGPLLVAHGSMDDPQEYVTTGKRAWELLRQVRATSPQSNVLVLGHTHRPWLVGSRRTRARSGELPTVGSAPYLVNPGSVGQSRQRERRPAARYAVLDLMQGRVDLRKVAYDVDSTLLALRGLNMPDRCVHAPESRRARVARAARVSRSGLRVRVDRRTQPRRAG